MGQAALRHGAVDDVRGALHQAALVGILNAEDELAAAVAGDEPGVQGGAEVAHVHVAGGGGGEAGTDAVLGDAGLHILKPVQIHWKDSFSNFITLFYIFRLRIVKAI